MTTRSLLIVLLVAAAPAAAQTPGWIADARTGCKVWNARPYPGDTIFWNGSCSNGLAQGPGVLQWLVNGEPTERYEGEFSGGMPNGHAVYTAPNGDRYEGEWRDDQKNGRGIFTWANGTRYDGYWRDNNRNGSGIATWANGDRYEGEWRNGRPDGMGTKTTSNGDVFSGTWTNGCFQKGDRTAWVTATKKECGFE